MKNYHNFNVSDQGFANQESVLGSISQRQNVVLPVSRVKKCVSRRFDLLASQVLALFECER